MIRVTIELISANTSKTTLLGVGEICNDGEGTDDLGNYEVRLLKSPAYARPGNVGQVWKAGKVKNFPRLRLGPWDLLYRCLRSCLVSRNFR